jgi:hypothetical protein
MTIETYTLLAGGGLFNILAEVTEENSQIS